MKNAISWFEIPSQNLDKAQVFYESVLSCKMRREAMGPSVAAVFPYDDPEHGVGGALMYGLTAPAQSRGLRLSTAHFLAERLEVSVRTVYRYVTQLQAQGVPIEGEAGVGYRMGKEFSLPPLMFILHYRDSLDKTSVRTVQPLGCFFWGKVWTCGCLV
jgi:predicted enzyme related to lactoylglutathione lyase